MESIERIVSNWIAHLVANPDLDSAEYAVALFSGDGFRNGWLIELGANPKVLQLKGEATKADCTIRIAESDLSALYENLVTPQSLFVDNRMNVQGDFGIARYFCRNFFGATFDE